MARVNVGHITLNVEETGEGPVFLFIPGLVGLLNAWQYQIDEFSKRYRCISFDHRGAGDSDRPALDQYSTEDIAGDVIALMDKLGIECHVQYKDGPAVKGYRDQQDFLIKKLTGK